MREVGIADTTTGLETTFKTIINYAQNCRFKDYTHVHENGCAILEALENEENGDESESIVDEFHQNESDIAEKYFGESENSEESSKDIDKKFETFQDLSLALAEGDFSRKPKEKDELLTEIQEKYFQLWCPGTRCDTS